MKNDYSLEYRLRLIEETLDKRLPLMEGFKDRLLKRKGDLTYLKLENMTEVKASRLQEWGWGKGRTGITINEYIALFKNETESPSDVDGIVFREISRCISEVDPNLTRERLYKELYPGKGRVNYEILKGGGKVETRVEKIVIDKLLELKEEYRLKLEEKHLNSLDEKTPKYHGIRIIGGSVYVSYDKAPKHLKLSPKATLCLMILNPRLFDGKKERDNGCFYLPKDFLVDLSEQIKGLKGVIEQIAHAYFNKISNNKEVPEPVLKAFDLKQYG